MPRLIPTILLGLVLASPSAYAEMATSFQHTGKLALEIAASAGGNNTVASGTLSLSRLPATATVVKATLYASQVNNAAGLRARFAGVDLGSTGPAAADSAAQDFYSYRWDVTGLLVPGTLDYAFTVSFGNSVAGVALAVVWQDVNEPTRMVTLVEGMRQIGDVAFETETVQLQNQGSGDAKVSVFTILDDALNSGETIDYNSSTIGGPIDQNLGYLSSLIHMDTTSQTGENSLSIRTQTDHMGWMLAGVEVTMPPVSTTDSTWSAMKSLYR
jgi:hypothetical protein